VSQRMRQLPRFIRYGTALRPFFGENTPTLPEGEASVPEER
jgi:hypothetical protein